MFKMPELINDDAFESLISMSEIVEVIEDFLVKKSLNKTLSPLRFQIDAQAGSLVFTAGGDELDKQVVGFRVYGTFDSPEADSDANFVSVFDSKTGRLKGLVFGGLLGAKRTAALAAVSLKALARENSENLGVIGTGFQAFYQVEAALAVRSFKHIKVFSRNPENCRKFAAEIELKFGVRSVSVHSAEEVVKGADVLILATSSSVPVIESSWVEPGTHVITMGPKFTGRHELPVALASRAQVIVTDSLSQLRGYEKPYFLKQSPDYSRIVEVGAVILKTEVGRTSPEDITLFLSVGTGGSEVLVADAVINNKIKLFY